MPSKLQGKSKDPWVCGHWPSVGMNWITPECPPFQRADGQKPRADGCIPKSNQPIDRSADGFGLTRYGRLRAFNLHAKARTHIGPVIPQGFVLRAAVVPKRDRVGFPAEPTGPFVATNVAVQKLQNRFAFRFGQFIDVAGEVPIHKNSFAPALRVSGDDGMT